jgi:hypothetical protein
MVCLGTTFSLPYLVSNMVSGLLQGAFHTVESWCGKIGLLVNPDRTERVVFTTRKRKLPGFFEPLFFFKLLCNFYVLVKYLGVVLDGACEYQCEEGSKYVLGL